MNPVDDYRKYCGSKLVYDASSHRRPVFLQRNLRKVLDHHEHNLNLLKHSSTNSTSDSAPADMLPKTENSRFLPSMNMLYNALKPARQTLNVQPKQIIKTRNSNGERIEASEVAKPESANPTWLPTPNQIRIRCNVHCSVVVHHAEDDKPTSVLYTDSRLAQLTETKDDKGESAFCIEMKPFVIKENQLLTTQLANHNTNGGRRWRTERHPQAALIMSISCFNSEDASQLLSVIDPYTSSQPILSPKQAELRASWKDLSGSIRSLSPLRRYQYEPEDQSKRSPSKSVDFSLRAGISWTSVVNSRGTPLAMCNHIIRLLESKIQPRVPEVPEMTRHPQTCRITYLFDGGPIGSRSILRTKLNCVFCPDRRPHPTFDRLHFHYLSFHDHFTFKVHKPAATDSDSIIRTVRIELSAPKYERASDNVCDEREITWIKPDIPFDLQQYLSEGGHNTWASGKQLALKAFPKTAKPVCMSKGIARPNPVNEMSRLTPNNRQLRVGPPEEVPEVPSRKRKRYAVPGIPGVAIFRAESKREVEPGEVLSESDAEPDDSWLRTKHRLEGFPQLTGAAREFAVLFDEHLQDEPRNLANVHVCEAVVRFVRKSAARLRQPHLLKELKSKLGELMDMDLIPETYVDYCLALVAEEGQATMNGTGQGHVTSGPVIKKEAVPSSTAQKSHNRLDVIMIDDSDTEPGAEVSPAVVPQTNGNDVHMQDVAHHAPNACVCGKVASGSRKVITCRNIHCPHNEFHMACVGLRERIPDWRCEDCRPAAD
ncbi:hypothetical protein KCU91_g10159, partial [Aureobasidium melanogenum]